MATLGDITITIGYILIFVGIFFVLIMSVNDSNTAMDRCILNYPDTTECVNSGFLSSTYNCIVSNGTILGQVVVK